MKTTPQLLRSYWNGALAALFLATTAIAADDTNAELLQVRTNAPDASGVKTAKHGVSISIGGAEDAKYPLPKEVLDRLTPEQILELEKSRHASSQVEDIVVPIAGIACPIAIVAIVMAFRHRRHKMLHETLRVMIEKGVAIPPELLSPQPRRRPKSDLRSGLIWAGIGVGLMVSLLVEGSDSWGLGLIPLLIGVGFLIAWKVEPRKVE